MSKSSRFGRPPEETTNKMTLEVGVWIISHYLGQLKIRAIRAILFKFIIPKNSSLYKAVAATQGTARTKRASGMILSQKLF